MTIHRVKKQKSITNAYREFAAAHRALKDGTPVYPAWEKMLLEEHGAVQRHKDLFFADDNKRTYFQLKFKGT